GFGLSPRRVTLSTAGLVPGIDRLAKESPRPRLAISLGAADDALRDDLMPINRKYDLEALLAACRRFPLGPRGAITFEYCLIDGRRRLMRRCGGRSLSRRAPLGGPGPPRRDPAPRRCRRWLRHRRS